MKRVDNENKKVSVGWSGKEEVAEVRKNVVAVLKGEVNHPGGLFYGKTSLVYSTRTTDVFVHAYVVNGVKYAEVIAVVYSTRQFYTPKKIFMGYVDPVKKRIANTVRKLKREGYRVRSSQVIFVGNFTKECITEARKIKRIDEIKVQTSVRIVPVKPKRKHRIGKFVVESVWDVPAVILYWVASWFRERFASLGRFLRDQKKDLDEDPLYKYMSIKVESLFVLLHRLFGNVISLFEPGGG